MEKDRSISDVEQSGHSSAVRHQRPPRNRHINTPQFAGRLGGLQEFSVDEQDPNSSEVLKKAPDASPIPPSHVKEWVHLEGFKNFDLWKRAAFELLATAFLTYLTGMQASALSALKINPLAVVAFVAIVTGLTLTLLIYCAGPVSGSHLNPLITCGATAIGMCTVSRAVLYVAFQTAGGVVGAYFLKASLGDDWFPAGFNVGCGFDTLLVSRGQVFLFEWILSFFILFVACGVGLDPRQQAVFGPALSPFLIGVSLAVAIFSSAFAKEGYFGAAANPARCLGLMAANGNLKWHWIHWVSMLTAAVSNGVLYHLIPPYGTRAT